MIGKTIPPPEIDEPRGSDRYEKMDKPKVVAEALAEMQGFFYTI